MREQNLFKIVDFVEGAVIVGVCGFVIILFMSIISDCVKWMVG